MSLFNTHLLFSYTKLKLDMAKDRHAFRGGQLNSCTRRNFPVITVVTAAPSLADRSSMVVEETEHKNSFTCPPPIGKNQKE